MNIFYIGIYVFMHVYMCNLVPRTSFRYNRKAKKRPWNTSNTRFEFAQIEGIFFRINYGIRG